MSETKTDGIRIVVNSEYIPDRSNPTKKRFFYAYHITIHNEGSQPAKLLSRYWHITDAEGNVEEVRGPGVVGTSGDASGGPSRTTSSSCGMRSGWGWGCLNCTRPPAWTTGSSTRSCSWWSGSRLGWGSGRCFGWWSGSGVGWWGGGWRGGAADRAARAGPAREGARVLYVPAPQVGAREQVLLCAHRRPPPRGVPRVAGRSEEHTSEVQSLVKLVGRLLREKKKQTNRLEY